MARKKINMKNEAYQILRAMLALGTDKQQAKKDGSIRNKITSVKTFKIYVRICRRFVDYCKKHGCKTLDDCKDYIEQFLKRGCKNGKPYSARTVKTYDCAIAKLYHCTMHDLMDNYPVRRRKDIKNSRGKKTRYSPNGKYKDQIRFVRASALRCSELADLRGNEHRVDKYGHLWVYVRRGKNGKPRWAMVIQDKEWVLEKMKAAGEGKVFPEVPQTLHRYRAEYATALYKRLARPLDQIPRKERYICRKDLKGVIYDKKAMQIVSNFLGHNRICVIAESYLRASEITGAQLAS